MENIEKKQYSLSLTYGSYRVECQVRDDDAMKIGGKIPFYVNLFGAMIV